MHLILGARLPRAALPKAGLPIRVQSNAIYYAGCREGLIRNERENPMPRLKRRTALSLFTGAGGLDLDFMLRAFVPLPL